MQNFYEFLRERVDKSAEVCYVTAKADYAL